MLLAEPDVKHTKHNGTRVRLNVSMSANVTLKRFAMNAMQEGLTLGPGRLEENHNRYAAAINVLHNDFLCQICLFARHGFWNHIGNQAIFGLCFMDCKAVRSSFHLAWLTKPLPVACNAA